MKLDDYSFELHQERVNKCHTHITNSVTLPFTYPQILTLLASNSLLSMMVTSFAFVIQLSLAYSHVPNEALMYNYQASYLVSIRLIFVITIIKILIIRFCIYNEIC